MKDNSRCVFVFMKMIRRLSSDFQKKIGIKKTTTLFFNLQVILTFPQNRCIKCFIPMSPLGKIISSTFNAAAIILIIIIEIKNSEPAVMT